MSACITNDVTKTATLNGRWVGVIGIQGKTKPMRIDFYGEPGNWHAVTERPDEPDAEIPLMNVQYQNPRLTFEFNDGPARFVFAGTLTGDLIKGFARGGEAVLELELRRAGDTPAAPFKEEAVRFTNGDATLHGSLVLPEGAGPHPAVVLIHGTGRQTRDEWRFFGMQFVRSGVAALLYDKRDVGHDPSEMDLVDLNDLAGDALAAVRLLKDRPDIRGDRIGLWGISQGGWVAPIAAAQSPDVAFIVGVSAPGVTYAQLNLFAVTNRLRDRGFSKAEISEATQALKRLDDFMRSGGDAASIQSMLTEARGKRWFGPSTLPDTLPSDTERRTWLRWRNLDLDPATHWERVRAPVILFYGADDNVVPVAESVTKITGALRKNGNQRVRVKVIPGADHELTIASDRTKIVPEYFLTLSQWMRDELELKTGFAPKV